MKDYVKYITVADAVKVLFNDCIRYVFPTTAEPTTEFIKLNNAINLLRLYPSADVEPVVRCKDCKFHGVEESMGEQKPKLYLHYCEDTNRIVEPTCFCSFGERKDNEDR